MNRPAILTRPGPPPPPQNLALFRIYVAYRSLLSIVLLIMLVSPNTRELVGQLNPAMYVTVALAHLATSVPLHHDPAHRESFAIEPYGLYVEDQKQVAVAHVTPPDLDRASKRRSLAAIPRAVNG